MTCASGHKSRNNFGVAFDLLETMRADGEGSIPLLERHLARLSASAQNLGFACNLTSIRNRIATENPPAECVLRLLLASDGSVQLQQRPLPPVGQLTRLIQALEPVSSSDLRLQHKTTDRAIYEQAKSGMPHGADALLVNERGEATETSIANIAVLREGRWVTPPVSCGLLPGVMRAHLLDQGEIVEGLVTAIPGETVRCFNAVRGVFDLPFTGILSA